MQSDQVDDHRVQTTNNDQVDAIRMKTHVGKNTKETDTEKILLKTEWTRNLPNKPVSCRVWGNILSLNVHYHLYTNLSYLF